MYTFGVLDSAHNELIHDVCYDYYGKRLATVSSDQRIKVWSQVSGSWSLDESWKAHDSSITKVCWAHPEFGTVIATCSFDRTIRIWEEQQVAEPKGRRWVEKARLADSKTAIQAVEFCPNHVGLKLATCSADGIVRIYEAMDVINLSQWILMEEFLVTNSPSSTASSRESVLDAMYALSWCKSRTLPETLVVSCGKENNVRFFRMDTLGKWQPTGWTLEGHSDVVLTLDWAPHMGRTYQLIATGSRDGKVRIFKLEEDVKAHSAKKVMNVKLVAEMSDHDSDVWKVKWNTTGTILCSSGEDGKVRLWKSNFLEDWKVVGIINAEESNSV